MSVRLYRTISSVYRYDVATVLLVAYILCRGKKMSKQRKRRIQHRPPDQAYGRRAEGEGVWGVLSFVHGRSRMTIDPRIPAMPGRGTSGFRQPGSHCFTKRESAVRCSASHMKDELHHVKHSS